MSKSIGNVKLLEDGNYEGLLAMGVNERIRMVQNEARDPKSEEPDFIIFGDTMGEVGAAWHMTGDVSGKKYKPASFEHPNITARKVYANLDRLQGAKDKIYALIWYPPARPKPSSKTCLIIKIERV